MECMETYGETLLDKVRRPIIVSQGRKLFSGIVWDTRGLEDDLVREREGNKRNPGCCLFRVDIRSWILCGTSVDSGLVIQQLGQDEPWGRMEHIELE